MTLRTPTYLKSVFEQNDTPQGSDYADIFDSFLPLTATGKQTLDIGLNISGDFTASGNIYGGKIYTVDMYVGDMGNEATGINIGGTTYNSTFKVSDINGTNYAQSILHRHSTTFEPIIVGARSNSDTTAHATLTSGQNAFTIYGAGWAGANYKLFGSINIGADTNGVISDSASPGRIIFNTTRKSSTNPTTSFILNSDGDATFSGNVTVSALQRSVNSSVAATGTTTAAAKQLFDSINVVKTATSASNEALIIGKCRPGMITYIINDASASARVFPTSASKFNQLSNGVAYDIPDRTTLAIYHITSAQYFTSRTSR
jgi:hypothetical protein